MNNTVKAFVLGTVLAVMAASCGGASPVQIQPKATDDPIAGTYVIKGGGGAIDSVRALTTAFSKMHPTVVWPKFKALAEGAAIASKKLWG